MIPPVSASPFLAGSGGMSKSSVKRPMDKDDSHMGYET
jgi:hypothetical protein